MGYDVLSPQTPVTAGWILIEHPGPWGQLPAARSALVEPRIREAAARHRLSLNLIRRYGRQRPRPDGPPGTFSCFLVGLRESGRFVEELTLTHQDQLTDQAIELLAQGRPSGLGRLGDEPLYLVCSHGRVEAACAVRGRPVARELTAAAPGRVWESTHVGGCRFAANVVCLPAGVYYGYVPPADAGRIVEATREGRIAPAWYRGRVGLPASGQTADAFLRHAINLAGTEAIKLVKALHDGNGLHHVEFTSDWAHYTLLLRDRPPAPHAATCPPERRQHSGDLQVVSMVETRRRG
ncbi:sucrase ferredoxin [Catellatospora vulcania]|uniref:sucrase ferredoxin n=1 Tax=Catellatospora vulcania TaxID=1460450 RepID=UPI0012D45FD9|nr:sucrase ferredoxin [Catellatospora vulcania]